MGSLILKGGWVMVPIILGSVVALALVLERCWYFWRNRADREAFAESIFSLVRAGNLAEARELCENARHPLAATFLAGLERSSEDPADVDRVMEREAARQIQHVERNLNHLVVVIGVEPLLGFLGTILGLIQAFMSWERLSTSVSVSDLAAGIYQAMITTAAGLIVAIPYYVIYNIFLSKVNTVVGDLNHYGDELVALLRRRGSAAQRPGGVKA